jgi:HK97 family phage major capsid protein
MPENEKVIETLQAVAGSLEGIKATLATQGGEIATLKAEVEKRAKADNAPIRVDDAGHPIIGTPAVIKNIGGDSRPLYVTNVIKAMLMKDWGMAKEEKAMSDRLVAAGYSPHSLGGVMLPMAPELMPDDCAPLREECHKRMHIGVDPGELAHTLRRFPQVAKAFGMVEKDLKLGDDTLGGFLVPTTQADRIIDLLRNRVVMQRAGAQEIPLPPSGNTTWPKLASDPTFAWGDADRTGNITPSDVKFDVLRLRAKQLIGSMAIPNDLIRYSSPSVELIARTALAAAAAVAEDLAGLHGAGTDQEPKGLLNYPLSTAETPTRGKVTLHVAGTTGGSGDTLTSDDIATILALYEESNDPDQPTGWIMRPRMWAAITNRRSKVWDGSAASAVGPYDFPVSRGALGNAPQKRLQDVDVFTTLQAKNNRVKSATNLVYILFGNFNRWVIARSGAMELAASEHVRFLQDQTVLKAILRSDCGPTHEESFILTDVLLQQ